MAGSSDAMTNIVVAARTRCLLEHEKDSLPIVVHGKVIELRGQQYPFDYVFGPESTNQQIFDTIVKSKIPNLFEGFNVTILAYGSTGSGKTFTMGTDYTFSKSVPTEQMGIVPQGIEEIFKIIEQEKNLKEFIVKVSFIEIYYEEIFDLGLSKQQCQFGKNKLQIVDYIAEDGSSVVEVKNINQVIVHDTKEALQYLLKGSKRRHVGETAKNKFSSRSHAIINVLVQQADKATGAGKSAKFQLVDLAGSERANTSQTSGDRLKEAGKINQGLFQLSNVIMELSKVKHSYINYRSSKLTHILRDSMGGNTYTVMIACVNPSSTSSEETANTLRYASSARKIKNQPKVNVGTAAEQLKQLQKEYEAINTELNKLKAEKFNSATAIFDNKVTQKLESAYFQVNLLNERMLELVDQDNELRERLKSFSDTLKEVLLAMTPDAVTEDDINSQKNIIEQVQQECYRLWMQKRPEAVDIGIEESKSDSTTDPAETVSELNSSGDSSDEETDISSGKQNFKEVEDRQKYRMNQLNSIQLALQVKENMYAQLNFLQDHVDVAIQEEKESQLENQIKELMREKADLLKTMETEKLGSKENAEKVSKYEEQLKELKAELQKVKRSLQIKWETKEKVEMLKKEIEELKKTRVSLTKEKNLASKQILRIEQQKNKDIMQLKRRERKQEIERQRLAHDYESKIRVLEARVQKYEIARLQRFKKLPKSDKPKSTLTKEPIEERVRTAIQTNLMKIELEEMKSEADKLEGEIRVLEMKSPDENKDSSLHDMKCKLQVLLDQINLIKSSAIETKGKSLLDSLPNISPEAKAAIETLLNNCVSLKMELTKLSSAYDDDLKKNKELMEKNMKNVINESEAATKELESKIELLEKILSLKKQLDLQTQEAKVLEDLTNFPSEMSQVEASSSNSDGNEEQEDLDKKILALQATCDEKNSEVAELKKQLKDLKSRKRNRKWLSRLSSEEDPSKVQGRESMLETYFSFSSEHEESFSNDQNDPDWRATPLHKQAKRPRVGKSSSESREKKRELTEYEKMVEKNRQEKMAFLQSLKFEEGQLPGPSQCGSFEAMDTSETDFVSTNKAEIKCQCGGDCKSNRCKCKKSNLFCTDACKCVKEQCTNLSEQK